jgi:hypothetical protein
MSDAPTVSERPEGSRAHLGEVLLHRAIPILVAAVVALAPCNQAAAQASTLTGSVTTVLKDNSGLCQINVPNTWQLAKSGVNWANGPGGNTPQGTRAHVQAKKSSDSWDAQKQSLKDQVRGETILYDDANLLMFEYAGLNSIGYTLTAARPAKGFFCWVDIDSGASGARAQFAHVFREIADSLKPVG